MVTFKKGDVVYSIKATHNDYGPNLGHGIKGPFEVTKVSKPDERGIQKVCLAGFGGYSFPSNCLKLATENVGFPMPNDKVLGGTVIASTWYNEDDYEYPLVLIMLLMPQAPFYRVGNVWLKPAGYEWETEPEIHWNIVGAVRGDYDQSGPRNPFNGYPIKTLLGYEQLGGDY